MVESLDAGNSVIHQPADWSPSSAALLADCAHQAGFPAGACNLVQGIGEEVGAALVADPGVRPITFIGSPPTAGHIGRAAAEAVELANSTAYIGREGGVHALEFHSDRKTLMILNDSVS